MDIRVYDEDIHAQYNRTLAIRLGIPAATVFHQLYSAAKHYTEVFGMPSTDAFHIAHSVIMHNTALSHIAVMEACQSLAAHNLITTYMRHGQDYYRIHYDTLQKFMTVDLQMEDIKPFFTP